MLDSKKKAIRNCLVSFLALMIAAVLVWGTTTGWFTIKNRHISFSYSDYNGQEYKEYNGDAILMIPSNATAETPAPAVMIFHGNSSQAHSMATLGTELSRRGYVVMLVNLPGAGYSDMVGQTSSIKADTSRYIEAAYQQLASLNYVQPDTMTAFGFSSGTRAAALVATTHKEAFNTVVWGSSLIQIDTVGGWGKEWDMSGLNLVTISTKNTGSAHEIEGSFADRTANITHHLSRFVLHTFQMYDKEEITVLLDYINQANPAPVQRGDNDYTYFWPEVISLFGFAALTALMITLAQFFLQMNFFKSLLNSEPKSFVSESSKTNGFLKAILSIVVSFLVMYIFVIKLEVIPKDKGIPLIPLWFNVYIPYFVGISIFQYIMFYLFHRKTGKAQGGNLVTYGISWGSAGENVKNLGKSLLLALLTGGISCACLYFVEKAFCVSFHFEFFAINTTQPYSLVHSWFYIVMYIVLFVAVGLNDSVAKAPRDTGHPLMDTVVDAAISSLVALVPILIVVVINISRGMGLISGSTNMPADHLVGYPFIIIMTTVVNTILNRKTRRPWVSAMVSAVFCGYMLVCSYSLQATLFG